MEHGERYRVHPGRVRAILAAAVLLAQLAPAPANPAPQRSRRSPEKVYTAGDKGVRPPKPVKRVAAKYDEAAKAERVEGIVKVDVTVSAKGTVSDVALVQKLDRRLDAKAVEAARKWQFQPAMLNGTPVAFKVMLEFSFNVSPTAPG